MERFVIAPIVALLLLSPYALAQDKPADKPAVAEPAKTEVKSNDPVKDAGKDIDNGIKDIDKNPGETVSTLVQMAKEGRWGSFVGLLVMFMIWVLRKFIWKLIPKNVLPWVTLGVGMIVAGALELGLGVAWWKILIDAFGASATAMAFWSLLFKHFMKPKEENA